jgi:hypothetical protein
METLILTVQVTISYNLIYGNSHINSKLNFPLHKRISNFTVTLNYSYIGSNSKLKLNMLQQLTARVSSNLCTLDSLAFSLSLNETPGGKLFCSLTFQDHPCMRPYFVGFLLPHKTKS